MDTCVGWKCILFGHVRSVFPAARLLLGFISIILTIEVLGFLFFFNHSKDGFFSFYAALSLLPFWSGPLCVQLQPDFSELKTSAVGQSISSVATPHATDVLNLRKEKSR